VQSPRWLSEPEQRAWRAFLDALRMLPEALDDDLQRNSGMSLADYEVLVQLSEARDRALRMGELAAGALVSRSRLSHAIVRLEGVGWVERRVCPSDKRGKLCVLTDAGFAALEAAAPFHVEAVRRFVFDALGCDDAAELGRLADAIRTRLPAAAQGLTAQAPQRNAR
jgi:DNA-binding MarR family transcriptional regulator